MIHFQDNALAGALGQCPFSDGLALAFSLPILASLRMAPWAIWDRLKLAVGLQPSYAPISAEPGKFGILTTCRTDHGMHKLQLNEGDYLNKIQAPCVFQFPFYRPRKNASKITCPFFLSISESDNLCPPKGALEAVKAAPKGELIRVKGGHFDCYPQFSEYECSIKAQLEFLGRIVPV